MQLDNGYKGFSFSKEGPLDMRMDPENKLTAKAFINHSSEKELGAIFRDLGEENQWRKAAKSIVEARRKTPFETTSQLADFLKSALGFKGKRHLHPATLIFQGLRIAVNQELHAIQAGLTKAISFLSKEGRMGVLSFHSLEDRIAKNIFKAASFRKKGDEGVPVLKLLTKKPFVTTFGEIKLNPRSRSAKLRFAEKI
jgi:16S rRNA (cytosine1402-N4)-methyltransferase